MKITIEPTAEMTTFEGHPVRVWTGCTEGGVPCKVFVAALAAPHGVNYAEFEAALVEIGDPIELLPLRRVLMD